MKKAVIHKQIQKTVNHMNLKLDKQQIYSVNKMGEICWEKQTNLEDWIRRIQNLLTTHRRQNTISTTTILKKHRSTWYSAGNNTQKKQMDNWLHGQLSYLNIDLCFKKVFIWPTPSNKNKIKIQKLKITNIVLK